MTRARRPLDGIDGRALDSVWAVMLNQDIMLGRFELGFKTMQDACKDGQAHFFAFRPRLSPCAALAPPPTDPAAASRRSDFDML